MNDQRLTKEERDEYMRLQEASEKLAQEANDMAQGNYVAGDRSENRVDAQDQILREQEDIRERQREILDRARQRSTS
ncbi:MAG: hypothetical protein QMD53_05985 [Actinomycetota bacterium]|nr:hypothetical protein [Actinomycetota bacterium]